MTGLDTTTDLLKALADPARLRLLHRLTEGPGYLEELAAGLGLAAPTVSHHLKKLVAAGLVTRRKEQYYVIYRARLEALRPRLRDLVAAAGDDRADEAARLARYRRKVLDTFFADGRLLRLPAQHKKRLIVLAAFAADFADDREYAEDEVNAVIAARGGDHCAVRREMVDARLMTRASIPGQAMTYRRSGAVDVPPLAPPRVPPDDAPHPEEASCMTLSREERRQRIELYKQARRTAGVYGVRNTTTGRVLLGSSLNLQGPLNRHRSELGFGSHRCRALQDDWNRLGAGAFVFEVLDTVDAKLEGLERDAALKELEGKWLDACAPLAEKTYNENDRIRHPA